MSVPTPRKLLTEAEVGNVLGVSARTIHRLIQAGELSAVQVGRFVRISPSALEAYQDTHQIAAGELAPVRVVLGPLPAARRKVAR